MKVTILLTTYNRPQYLKRCLASLKRANITDVLIVDDCSTDNETLKLIQGYGRVYKPIYNFRGICGSLLYGIDSAFASGADIVINLDADAIVRNDFLAEMIELHKVFPDDLITGFHSLTKNDDGSERHEVIEWGPGYCVKKSVGGINMLWTKQTWEKYKPVIQNAMLKHLNWDHEVSKASNGIVCAIPSLVQHIGIESAMGHTGTPDIAADFKMLSLPNVTLVCVDDNYEHGRQAIAKCEQDIEFGKSLVIYDRKLGSKEGYSKFIIQDLHKYIDTDYALIVQHDGYVKNVEAWTDEYLQYDYIGACWWYKDGMNVGNGGFSLRSKKLLQMTAEANWTETHPEDHVICRTHRKELEAKGIKFAPDELANKFSFEGYYQTGTWNGQFGFHGGRAFRTPADPKKQGFIINQFLGLGDILFLVPLIRHWMSLGHDVIWPIADEYFDIKRHFPDIQFCKKSDWKGVKYDHPGEYMHKWQYGMYQVKPLRWNRAVKLEDAMPTKYTMYGQDFNMWRKLYWEADIEREQALSVLLQTEKEYALIFQEFGNVTDGGAAHKIIDIPDGMQKVYVSKLDGYSLLDWSGVIQNATIIHAVSSSCLYLFEMLNLKAKEVHLYSRKAGHKDFEMVKPILTKNYILHS